MFDIGAAIGGIGKVFNVIGKVKELVSARKTNNNEVASNLTGNAENPGSVKTPLPGFLGAVTDLLG